MLSVAVLFVVQVRSFYDVVNFVRDSVICVTSLVGRREDAPYSKESNSDDSIPFVVFVAFHLMAPVTKTNLQTRFLVQPHLNKYDACEVNAESALSSI